jgi:putative effector of murein hydrolase
LVKAQLDAQVSIAKGTAKWILILTGFLALVVVIAVILLAHWDKLSSDAVSIVLGTVIGSSFTFLMRAYSSRKE